MRFVRTLAVVSATAVALGWAAPTFADNDNNGNNGLQAKPFEFVGNAPGCAPFPSGSRIVTAAWLGGMGLPDNGDNNVSSATPGGPEIGSTASERNDPHFGLLLSKNGPESDCSSAGATISGFSRAPTT